MKDKAEKPESIDEYITLHPPKVQKILQTIRTLIRNTVPEAEEVIKYQIPTFIFHGNLVHFAAYKSHIGFYPAPSGIEAFKKDLAVYGSGKGSVQFPIDQDLPIDLIIKIVQFRLNENLEKQLFKKQKRGVSP